MSPREKEIVSGDIKVYGEANYRSLNENSGSDVDRRNTHHPREAFVRLGSHYGTVAAITEIREMPVS